MPTNPVLPLRSIRASSGFPLIDPIILVPRNDPFDDPEWIFEPKYDGFRGVIYCSSLGCEIRSRRDIPLKRFRSLWDRIAEVLQGAPTSADVAIVIEETKSALHRLERERDAHGCAR